MASPVDHSALCPVIVGRAPLLAALERAVEGACAGQGQTVLLAGEAGVGKTRLVREVKERVLQRGMAILEGHCFEPDRTVPYAPILDLLRASLADQSTADLARGHGPLTAVLALLVPEFAASIGDAELVALRAAQRDREGAQRWLFAAIAQYLAALATPQPLLLIIEDLHWCDDTSLQCLLFLSRQIVERPILLLLTFRHDEAHDGLLHCLANFDRERLASEFSVEPLSLGTIELMLRAIFGEFRALPADLVHRLYRLTEGNPFFIEESLKALLTAGDLTYADGRWEQLPTASWHIPRSVHDVVQRRVRLLGPDAKRVLTLAAVIGQRFDFGLLQTIGQIAEEALILAIKELVAAQLVDERAPDDFAFRHALTRQAVYAQLLARERRRLHRAVAEALEQRRADASDAPLAELAYHWHEATDWARTLAYARHAGERAQALYASPEAIEQFTRALEAAAQLALPLPAAILRARGQAYETLGEFEQARADYQAALDSARAAGDGHAEWQALLDLGAYWTGHDYAQSGVYLEQALERARSLEDPIGLAQSLNRFGNWLANTGRPAEGVLAHREALPVFEAIDDQPGTATTLDLLAMATVFSGDLIAAVGYLDRAVDLYRALDDRRGLASCLGSRGAFAASPGIAETTYAALWSPTDCLRDAKEAAELARSLGWPAGIAFAGVGTGPTSVAFGEYGMALAWSGQTLQIATEIGHQQWIIGAKSALGSVYTHLFLPDLAIEHLETALASARDLGSVWWLGLCTVSLVSACLLSGDLLRAEVALAAAQPPDAPPPDYRANMAARRLGWARGELALRRGDPLAALEIADVLLTTVPGGPRPQPIPTLLKLRGEALLELGQFDAARGALEEARRGAEERGLRPLRWQIARALGRLHERAKRPQEARREFAAARETIALLAMTIPDETRREHYRAAALATLPLERPLSPLGAARQASGGLTRREREVAALIAQGKSNREIAAALFLGEGTVATHVSSILGKLDFSSRAQIAAWAVERGFTITL